MVVSNYIKLVSGEFLSALRANINENFIRISFQCLNQGSLHFRFVMRSVGELEQELVDDIVAEFEAMHTPNELKKVEIVLENSVDAEDLEHLVFAKHL